MYICQVLGLGIIPGVYVSGENQKTRLSFENFCVVVVAFLVTAVISLVLLTSHEVVTWDCWCGGRYDRLFFSQQ